MHEDFPLTALDWSREAQLANQVWFSIDSANRYLLLERWGTERTAALEYYFLRKHQETHFLDGLAKLGLRSEPPHIASAKYHVLSNVLGGLDMGYRLDDQDRAWIFYFPPSPFANSSMLPSPGILGVPTEVILAGMRAWHANNGVLLGEPRLRFTTTSLLSEQGAFDAGYFDLADAPLAEDERLRVRLDGDSAVPGPPPALGEQWPQARMDTALRKYSAQYAVGGLAQIALRSSLGEAAEIARRSFTTVFVSWSRILLREFAIEASDPSERLVRLMACFFEIVGEEFEKSVAPGFASLRTMKSRLTVPEYAGWETLPDPILRSMAEAWSVVSRAVGPPLRVTVSGGAHPVWMVEEEGR